MRRSGRNSVHGMAPLRQQHTVPPVRRRLQIMKPIAPTDGLFQAVSCEKSVRLCVDAALMVRWCW